MPPPSAPPAPSASPARSRQGWPTWLQVGAISLGCVAGFFGLRALPASECSVLHAAELRQGPNGIEFCADEPAAFVDLSVLRPTLRLELRPQGLLRQGAPVELALDLRLPDGRALGPADLALVHTQKVHLLVIDETLGDYHHLHPVPDSAEGPWLASFTPRHAGRYRVYAEFVPLRTAVQVTLAEVLDIAPNAASPALLPTPTTASPTSWARLAHGLQWSLSLAPSTEPAPQRVAVNRDSTVRLRVAQPDGRPAPLELTMGALCHLVAFHESGRGLAHLHPLKDSPSGQFDFVFHTSLPGRYRLWAQVRLQGEDVFTPFDLVVE